MLTHTIKLLLRPLLRSGRKAFAMSTLPLPPAAAGGGDRFAALLDAVGRLAEHQRAVLDALRAAPPHPQPLPVPHAPPPAAASPSSTTAGVSLDDVRAVVADLLGRHRASADRTAARAAYVRDHLADLPDAYRRLMPDADDPAALADAEQAVRRQYRDDLKAARRSAGEPAGPPVGSGVAGGDGPAAAVDYSKLSPLGQIELGLRGTPTVRAPVAPAAVAANPGDPEPDPHEQLFVGAE